MRSYVGLLLSGLLLGSTGCALLEGTGDTTGGTGGGDTTGGDPSDPCKGVPTEGRCVDDGTIESCFISEEHDTAPQIITAKCDAGEICKIVNGSAACKPVGDCYDGDTRCADATTLEECVGGKWQSTDCGGVACVSQPGFGASCTQQEAGTGIKLRGHVNYEFHRPNADFTDFNSVTEVEPAVDMFVTVFDNGELIGMGLTSIGSGNLKAGDWEVELSRKPTDQTFYYFWPMLFDNNGNPRMALAHAQSSDVATQFSDEYWSFGFGPVCEQPGACDETDTGNQLITEDMGSGAVHIYQWLDYGIFRLEGLIPNIQPLTMAVYWEPGNKWDCGNCFAPPQMGGAAVLYDKANNLVDHYDSSINISGTDDTPSHWARTTINHEFGHWITASYSKSPGEGGPHFVDQASKPGLAYSEGWATFAGQSNLSNGPDDPDPIAFRKSGGTSFWVDLEKIEWSGGGIELPDPNGPIDQLINENVVTSMMWSLWASNRAYAPQGLGDVPMFTVLPSSRLVGNVNRGYSKVDMVDYLDALECEGLASGDNVLNVTEPVGYPYDHQPICQ